MKVSEIEAQLANYKIRQGYLLKRSRVVREWRKRWIVLTINFLFTFQSKECEKVTEIIDLKEVVGFRTYLKKQEDGQSNCFQIQSKSTDFAFSSKEVNEKWSWIVTLERLFDFKENGATSYNNIDQIRTQGFSSQNEYDFLQKSTIKVSRRIIFANEGDGKKEVKAEQLVSQLIERQDILNKKEEELIKKEKKMQKIHKMTSDCAEVVQQLSGRIKELQSQIEEMYSVREMQASNGVKRSCSVKRSFFSNPKEVQKQQQGRQRQLSKEEFIVHRHHCMEYLFDEFSGNLERPELTDIVCFLARLTVIRGGIFKQSIYTCLSLHQNVKGFIKKMLEVTLDWRINRMTVKQGLCLMALTLEDQNIISKHYFESAQKVILDWCATFDQGTQFEMLSRSISLLSMMVEKTRGIKNCQQLQEVVKIVSQLSKEQEFRRKCQTIVGIASVPKSFFEIG